MFDRFGYFDVIFILCLVEVLFLLISLIFSLAFILPFLILFFLLSRIILHRSLVYCATSPLPTFLLWWDFFKTAWTKRGWPLAWQLPSEFFGTIEIIKEGKLGNLLGVYFNRYSSYRILVLCILYAHYFGYYVAYFNVLIILLYCCFNAYCGTLLKWLSLQ